MNAAADLIQTIWMKHWDWSAKGVVKCLGGQNESRKVNRNIPNGQQTRQGQCCLYQSWQDMSWMLAKLYRFGYEPSVADEQLEEIRQK